jgi:hypothetical protein
VKERETSEGLGQDQEAWKKHQKSEFGSKIDDLILTGTEIS